MSENNILFVWDFHGVLEKDNEYAVQNVCKQVFKEFGIEKDIPINEIKKFYGMKWSEYYKSLLPDLDNKTIFKMVERSLEIGFDAALNHIKPREGAKEVLKTIRTKGHRNIVISNTEPLALKFFIDIVELDPFINSYFGTDVHNPNLKNPKTKSEILGDYLKKNKFKKIIVIGDTESDMKAGLDHNAITYLFSTDKNKTSKTKAHHVISDLREVLKEIK